MTKLFLWFICAALVPVTASSAARESELVPNSAEIHAATQSALDRSIEDFLALLRLPNNGMHLDQITANADWVAQRLSDLGLNVSILESDGVPHVFGEKQTVDARGTVLFYLQLDGQPVDASQWAQRNPFEPVLKRNEDAQWVTVEPGAWRSDLRPEDRIFARSSSDSKGPAIAFFSALQIMQDQGWHPAFNIKVIADFQEEMGSPTLPSLVEANRELFNADVMLVMDGTRHLSNLPTLTFGARGLATMKLTVFGAERDLHSGQFGNFAPNPVFALSRLLASMKDERGRVSIPGFYADVSLSDLDKRELAAVPENMDFILQSLGIAAPDAVGASYQESLQYPSLNVRGLNAAWVNESVRTIIPSRAIAEIDMRLVPETPGERQVALVVEHIRNQGFRVLDAPPTKSERAQFSRLVQVEYRIGSKPFRTDMAGPLGQWLSSAMQRVFGSNFVTMRTTGGSQPIAPFISTLGVPAVSVRIPNPDNNIHAPNENLRIRNFIEGIESCLSILTQPWSLNR